MENVTTMMVTRSSGLFLESQGPKFILHIAQFDRGVRITV